MFKTYSESDSFLGPEAPDLNQITIANLGKQTVF